MSSIYIHIPFCAHACPYCDFSFELLNGELVRRYMETLAIEIERRREEYPWRDTKFETLFFGGGTPTVLTPERLKELFEIIRSSFSIVPDAEITMEANPETLTDAKLGALGELGVNRLSVGVQAFTEVSLKRLGRHHSVDRAVRAVSQARISGISNLNLDLIYAAPEQTTADWDETLARTIDLQPDHLSAYELTIEEGTPFGRAWSTGKLKVPVEEVQVDLYTRTIDGLTAQGYHHYEVSNFAKPGAMCRHNLVYWSGGDYLGLGPSAHSHVQGRRFANTKQLERYIQLTNERGNALDHDENLSAEQQAGETIILGLRMIEGLDLDVFTGRFGSEAYRVRQPVISSLTAAGFLEQSPRFLRLTRKGLTVADTVCAELL